METELRRIPYFSGLDGQALDRVECVAHRHEYQAGATIFTEGGDCAGFHVVLDGLVRIYRVSREGRLHTLSLLRPYSTFNEVAAVDGGPNPYNAVSVTSATVLVIGHRHLLRLMAAEPPLLSNYVQSLAHVNREYIERLEDMTFRTIPSRLAKLFLHESTYADQIAETPTALTQEEIASILGTTPRSGGACAAWVTERRVTGEKGPQRLCGRPRRTGVPGRNQHHAGATARSGLTGGLQHSRLKRGVFAAHDVGVLCNQKARRLVTSGALGGNENYQSIFSIGYSCYFSYSLIRWYTGSLYLHCSQNHRAQHCQMA